MTTHDRLPEARNQAHVSDLLEAAANVNALVDHLRSTGVKHDA